MKKIFVFRMTMWRVVHLHLEAYAGIWRANGPFAEAAAELSLAIGDGWQAAEKQVPGSGGVSSRRDAMESEAIAQVLLIARLVKAFALNTDNQELYHHMRFGKSAIEKMGHMNRIATLRSMVNAAMPYSEGLVPYGIPPDAYQAALEALDALAVTHSSVRTAISDRKAVTRSLPQIMQAGSLALAKLDNLIIAFEAEHPEFVSGYKAARTIVHTGIRHKDDETPDTAEAN